MCAEEESQNCKNQAISSYVFVIESLGFVEVGRRRLPRHLCGIGLALRNPKRNGPFEAAVESAREFRVLIGDVAQSPEQSSGE